MPGDEPPIRCSLAGRREVLHLRMAQGAAVTYSVGTAPRGIWRGQVLMRCGPAFGLDGQPSLEGTPQNRVVLDGLARPQQAWSGCAALLGAPAGAVVLLDGTSDQGLAACLEPASGLVGLRLQQSGVSGVGGHRLGQGDDSDGPGGNPELGTVLKVIGAGSAASHHLQG